jgi:hypothetical protein
VGIEERITEKNYTSQVSFLDNDPLPAYGAYGAYGATIPQIFPRHRAFSGKQVKCDHYGAAAGGISMPT